jgi:hypothetical protein
MPAFLNMNRRADSNDSTRRGGRRFGRERPLSVLLPLPESGQNAQEK